MDEIEKNNGEIIIYRTEDGRTQLEVRLEDENVWLSQQQYLLKYILVIMIFHRP